MPNVVTAASRPVASAPACWTRMRLSGSTARRALTRKTANGTSDRTPDGAAPTDRTGRLGPAATGTKGARLLARTTGTIRAIRARRARRARTTSTQAGIGATGVTRRQHQRPGATVIHGPAHDRASVPDDRTNHATRHRDRVIRATRATGMTGVSGTIVPTSPAGMTGPVGRAASGRLSAAGRQAMTKPGASVTGATAGPDAPPRPASRAWKPAV